MKTNAERFEAYYFSSPGFCRDCGEGWQGDGGKCRVCGGVVNAEY